MTQSDGLVLYTYWRSSASYRVRLALAFKGLDYTAKPIHLIHQGGEHTHPDYLALNPQGLVPTLMHGQRVLTQSLAIIEYLDEVFPDPPLLPEDALERAKVRALALAIAADTAPLQNLRVLKKLEAEFGGDASAQAHWARHWISLGLDAVEKLLSPDHPKASEARYCVGNGPTMADCCLLPQLYNAERFGCDVEAWPTIRAICTNLGHNEGIEAAKPDNQPDAPKKTQ